MNNKDKIESLKNEEVKQILLNNLTDCFVMKELIEENYSSIGNSRIGGVPDFPNTWKYPVSEEFYFSFIAQINLAELSQFKKTNLPSKGWLYFFLGEDEQMDNIENKIYYYDGEISKLQKTEPPTELEQAMAEDRFFAPHKVVFDLTDDISWNNELRELVENNLPNDLQGLLIENTKVLGDSYSHDEKMEAQTFFKSDVKEDLIYLFQLKSNSTLDMEWWDFGVLKFLMKKSDFDNNEFSNTYACIGMI